MSENKKVRKWRTVEERIAEVDAKIAYHEEHVKTLQQRREDLINPPKVARKTSMKQIADRIKESGLSTEEVMQLIEKATK